MLCDDIKYLTDRALWETENLMKCIPDSLWKKRYDGIPMWKYFYHMLYSMDRWYINPYDADYTNPEFHTDTLADLNVIPPEDEMLTREQMEDYLGQIRSKIQNYTSTLEDAMLYENPTNCSMSRFRLILGQFRHWHRHMGVIYGFVIEDTGKWPYVLNMLGAYPDSPHAQFLLGRCRMVLNTGSRTDIPAYYSKWFYNRIREGFVLVRNPYYPSQVTRYLLDPEKIDVMIFCTKNPQPMFGDADSFKALLSTFDTFWFVTVTPYGTDIEPFVPPAEHVIRSFQKLSEQTGKQRISWRYDPIFVTEKYSVAYHIRQFASMAKVLSRYTGQCVVSFIDLYEKTRKNFRGVRGVTHEEQEQLIGAISNIAQEYGMQIHLCCENERLIRKNVDADGCMSKAVLEKALGCKLVVPQKKMAREACTCLLGADIGAYNTCGHGCLYCYANYDRETVLSNMKNHDPFSPFLIGNRHEGDIVKDAVQKSWKNGQLDLFDLI